MPCAALTCGLLTTKSVCTLSISESFARTSIVIAVLIGAVVVSILATGPSLVPVTVMTKFAVDVAP